MNTKVVLESNNSEITEQDWTEVLDITTEELIAELKPRITITAKSLHRKLARTNPVVSQEDIEQEMLMSILEHKSGYAPYELLKIATRDAIDLLLSKRVQNSYCGKFKHLSFEKLLDDGFKIDSDGVLHTSAHNWGLRKAEKTEEEE